MENKDNELTQKETPNTKSKVPSSGRPSETFKEEVNPVKDDLGHSKKDHEREENSEKKALKN